MMTHYDIAELCYGCFTLPILRAALRSSGVCGNLRAKLGRDGSLFRETPSFCPNGSDSVVCPPDPAVGDGQNLDWPYLPQALTTNRRANPRTVATEIKVDRSRKAARRETDGPRDETPREARKGFGRAGLPRIQSLPIGSPRSSPTPGAHGVWGHVL